MTTEEIILAGFKLIPTITAATISVAYARNAHYERTVCRLALRQPYRLEYNWKAAYIKDIAVCAVSAALGALFFKLFVL